MEPGAGRDWAGCGLGRCSASCCSAFCRVTSNMPQLFVRGLSISKAPLQASTSSSSTATSDFLHSQWLRRFGSTSGTPYRRLSRKTHYCRIGERKTGLENAKYVVVCYSEARVLSNWMSQAWMSTLARSLDGHGTCLLLVRLLVEHRLPSWPTFATAISLSRLWIAG
jgi:hypothetical protein